MIKLKVFVIIIGFMLMGFNNLPDFKSDQQKNTRVKEAYSSKISGIKELLKIKKINLSSLQIYLRVFKDDKIIELWGKNKIDKKFILIKTFNICYSSGNVGPKRKMGDYQVPEGFYYINRFNPWSNFYLSLGINYPNKSDRILGNKQNLGGDIFIHGNCVSVGCIPITDDKIKELYVYCVEAKNNGQNKIPVTIFPKKFEGVNYQNLIKKYSGDLDKLNLWEDLKKAYDIFEKDKKLPRVTFLNSGRHNLQ